MTELDRAAARAEAALARSGAWLDPAPDRGGGYLVRLAPDRRRRPALRFDEAVFASLAEAPGLRPRAQGGWTLRPRAASAPPPQAGRPGVLLGARAVAEADGRPVVRAANLGESPLAWLARRRDADGRPWLDRAELAAAERLREDVERAGLIGQLTMSWDAGPRAGGALGLGLDPAERAIAAKARVRAALGAVGPGLDAVLERICLTGSSLDAAERALHLPRRTGKTMLKLALQRLAAHYRIG